MHTTGKICYVVKTAVCQSCPLFLKDLWKKTREQSFGNTDLYPVLHGTKVGKFCAQDLSLQKELNWILLYWSFRGVEEVIYSISGCTYP